MPPVQVSSTFLLNKMQNLRQYLTDSETPQRQTTMSQNPSADQKAEQITETLVVHNLLKTLPENTQDHLRQMALREQTTIIHIARKAILHYTQPRAA